MIGQSRTLQSSNEPVGVMADLVRALDWFDNGLQNVLASLGYKPLHRTQSMIMVHVASGVESPADIARSMGLSRQNVHHMAKALIADGLIEQAPDPADPRRTLYRLAGSAAEIRRAALETLAQLELVLAGRIGLRSLHALRGALGKDWGDAIAGGEALAAELDGHDVLAN
ncbi:MAG TPA: MarR family transcriptional regulator [Pseudomonadales bacterium]